MGGILAMSVGRSGARWDGPISRILDTARTTIVSFASTHVAMFLIPSRHSGWHSDIHVSSSGRRCFVDIDVLVGRLRAVVGIYVLGCFLTPPSLPLGVRAVWGNCVFARFLYSSTSPISAWFMLAYLNSGRSGAELVGTDSKLHSPRSARIRIRMISLIVRSSRAVYDTSIFLRPWYICWTHWAFRDLFGFCDWRKSLVCGGPCLIAFVSECAWNC